MVVLKPNLVDYLPGSAINTHPMLGLAAAETFRRLGAESVVVAEGRDINGILSCCYSRVLTRNPGWREAPIRRSQARRTDTYTASRKLHWA